MDNQKITTTAKRLEEIMEERNLRQVDILELCQPYCEKFGVKISKSHLSQWLHGTNVPAQKRLTILCLALRVSEPWLMGYDTDRTNRMTFDAPSRPVHDSVLKILDDNIEENDPDKVAERLRASHTGEEPKEFSIFSEEAAAMLTEEQKKLLSNIFYAAVPALRDKIKHGGSENDTEIR